MSLNHLPQAERLLSGKLTADLSDSATTASVDTPPSIDKLPTYIEFEPGGDNAELCRVVDVNSGVITIERGLNNGGIGLQHLVNTAYKQKFTSRHFQALVEAIEYGCIFVDTKYVFAKVDSDTFSINGIDESLFFLAGRSVLLNGNIVSKVVSSSYAGGVTTVNIADAVVPTTINTIGLEIKMKGKTTFDLEKASAADINTGTEDTKYVTSKQIKDSDLAYLSDITVTPTSTNTLTNKRITSRTGTATDAATHTINADNYDEYTITAQAQAFTVAAPTGTPTEGQKLILRIKDNGTARAITWNTIFRASSDLALPTTTVLSKTLYCGFIYNATDSKWDLIALLNNI